MKDTTDAPLRLPAEIEAFLGPEMHSPDPPAGLRDEIFARVRVTLGFPGGGAPDGGDHGPSDGPTGGNGSGAAVAGRSAAKLTLAAHPLLGTVATLVIGAAVGAGVHEAHDRHVGRRVPEPSLASKPAPAEDPAPAPPPRLPSLGETVVDAAAVPELLAPAARTRSQREAPVQVPARDRNLAVERALIEQARTSLSRSKPETALLALERHARAFPHGELEEERESLLVQTLVQSDRADAARSAGARFHQRFPRSIFTPVVDEALESIP